MRVGQILTATLAIWASSAVAGGVYKCTDAHGAITYQQVPCPSGSKEQVPMLSSSPTLTAEEKFDAAAYRAGMTPDEARALLAGHGTDTQDVSTSAPSTYKARPSMDEPAPAVSDPQERAFRCTKPNGSTYYSRTGCGTTHVREPAPDWQNSHSTIVDSRGVPIPGAVRTGPNNALDPRTGQTFSVIDTTPRRSHKVQDQAELMDRREACEEAKQQGIEERKNNPKLSFDDRRRLDDAVYDLCKAGQRAGD